MELLHLYKHKNGRDVAIMPLEIRPLNGGYFALVKYYNLASPGRAPWSMGIRDWVEIVAEQVPNYVDISDQLEKK